MPKKFKDRKIIRCVIDEDSLMIFFVGNPDSEIESSIADAIARFGFKYYDSNHSVTGLRSVEFRKE